VVDPVDAGAFAQPELGGVAADHVGQLGALTDQPVAFSGEHQVSLLVRRFDRHEAHRRPACHLAQRLGIGGVVLATLDVGFGDLRCYQFATPMRVNSSTGGSF
jgi:hypothetical protein